MSYELSEVEIEVIKLRESAGDLSYGSKGAAAIDLRACLDDQVVYLWPGQTALIPTGYKFWIRNPSLVGIIVPRSGLGHKEGIVLGNSTGVIDADYQGELMVSLWNRNVFEPSYYDSNASREKKFEIRHGDRIAQFMLSPILHLKPKFVKQFSNDTDRGEGGFGSTGVS